MWDGQDNRSCLLAIKTHPSRNCLNLEIRVYLRLHSKAIQVCQLTDSRSGPRTFCQMVSRLFPSMDFHSRAMLDNKVYRSQCLIQSSRICLNLASRMCLILASRMCLLLANRICLNLASRICLILASSICNSMVHKTRLRSRICRILARKMCLSLDIRA